MLTRFISAGLVLGSLAASASASIIPFNFAVSPQQEVPANSSTAIGAGQLLYDNVAHTFNLNVFMFGINPANITGYHIHNAPAGSNGPIVIDLVPLGTWSPAGQGIGLLLTNVPIGAFEPQLLAGNLYFNVHTTAFPGGEARGQIIPSPASMSLLAMAGLIVARRRHR